MFATPYLKESEQQQDKNKGKKLNNKLILDYPSMFINRINQNCKIGTKPNTVDE
jgi:hypothetical protein